MLIWFSWLLVDFINNLVLTFYFRKINCINKNLNIKDYLYILIASIITSNIIIYVEDPSMRFILKLIIVMVLYKMLYNLSVVKTSITTCLMYIIVITSEMIYTFLFKILRVDFTILQNNFIGIITINLLILILICLTLKNKFVNNLFSNIVKWCNNSKVIRVVLICIIAEITMFYLIYQNYSIEKTRAYFFINDIFFIGIFLFIIGYFKQRTDNHKLLHDYDQLLEYSKEYEKEVVEKSKKQHEHRNQLVIIKSMIVQNDKGTVDYINGLLKEPSGNKDFRLINKLSYIYSNGLKGLIYYKIKEMRKNKINVSVDISEQINDKKLWKICDNNLKDISRCLGVYIDNAIEAASISNDKMLMIEVLKEDDNIVFIISNTFNGELDLSKFDKEGYSSKGKNRGYGLSLVKEIINNNEFLIQEREVIGEYYIQKLYIKSE